MSTPARSHDGPRTAAALAGAALFAASLIYAGVVYVVRFADASGSTADRPRAIVVDVALFTLFAIHHSVFARTGVKAWIARTAPRLERTIYVVVASVLFIGAMAAWQRVPGVVWRVGSPVSLLLIGVQIAGVVLTLVAARELDVFALAGVRQAIGRETDRPAVLVRTGTYGFVRHPVYFAWLLMVWPSPLFTGSRALFAVVSTAYLVLAVPIEERTLRRTFGPAYDDYARTVRWRMVPVVY
jgi:protein-S-isoprenylcysteine O-methyltransferase Ste14